MTYDEMIVSDPVVLVEFYADWCPHCHRMMPIVEEVKELLEGKAKVCQIEIDQNREIADQNDVQSVPTFIIYRDGQEMWRQSGEMDGEVLLTQVQQYC